jgi:hypothetical protein
MIECLAHRSCDTGLVGDIGIDSDSIGLRPTGSMAIDDDHSRAGLYKSRRDGLAQSSPPSGNDHDFSVHSHHRAPVNRRTSFESQRSAMHLAPLSQIIVAKARLECR